MRQINVLRTLTLLIPALLVGQLCLADPLNGGIRSEDIIVALLLLLAAGLAFAAAPVVSYLSYKRPDRQLNIVAWVLVIITKLACMALTLRGSIYSYWQWAALAGILPNTGLYLLLLKAERSLQGRQFQLAFYVRSILGIIVAGNLLSLLAWQLVYLSSIGNYMALNASARLAATVWFVYQYLVAAPAKGVTISTGMAHAFLWGLAITAGLFVNDRLPLQFLVARSYFGSQASAEFFTYHSSYRTLFVAASLLSGVVAYWLYSRRKA